VGAPLARSGDIGMNRIALAFLLMGALVAGQGCSRSPVAAATAAPADAKPEPAIAVRTAQIVAKKMPATLELTGSLVADEISEVAAASPGIVREVAVDLGTRVKAGDVLVRIDPRDAGMRLTQASAAAAQASARLGIATGQPFRPTAVPEVRVAKEALDLAETEATRAKSLFEGGSAAKSVWDQAKARAEQARSQYDAALNGAKQAWAGLEAARATVDLSAKAAADTDVRAPFDGIVNEKRIAPGEYAQPGRVVAVVLRDDPLRVRFDVPEADAAKVVQGAEVMVSVAAWPDRVFLGKVARIGGALRAQSRALPVEAEVPNPAGELKPGYFARVSIVVTGADLDTLLVPASAVGSTGSAARLFVVQGKQAVEHIIAVGRKVGDQVVVRGALQPGETIAIDNVSDLTDGARVSVIR
jgi:RND family efflux transporter MFP subunit